MSTTASGTHGSQHSEADGRDSGQDSFFVRFAREYGWRAYVIPVLALLTVWILIDVFVVPAGEPDDSAAGTSASAGEVASEPAGLGPGPDPADAPDTQIPPTQLPPGGAYARSGDGTFRTVGTPGLDVGQGTEVAIRYVVEVENGVNTDIYGGDDTVAALVDATLADPRGWTNDPRFSFEHVAQDENPNLRIRLTSVETTHEMCGADLAMETSCRTTITGENVVFLNDSRWARGAETFEGDLGSYRQYLINHEVGHALGYQRHVACGEDGALAPIMMQQTLSLNNSELNAFNPAEIYPDNDATCRYNAWPYPEPGVPPEAPGGPGAPEAPPTDAVVGAGRGMQ